jgi:thioredoxin-related protein
MKLNLYLFIILSFFLSCASTEKEQEIKTGKSDLIELRNNFEWFRTGYYTYHPDPSFISKLKVSLQPYRIIIFGGTWCRDTQRLLPQFYKAIDEAEYPEENTTLYLVDRKIHSPEKLEETYRVKSIPAFIILKDERETGRIVENIKNSIEEDLSEIVK